MRGNKPAACQALGNSRIHFTQTTPHTNVYEPSRLSSQGHLSLLKTATSTFVQSDVAMENSLGNNGHGNGHCQTVPTAYTSLGSAAVSSSAPALHLTLNLIAPASQNPADTGNQTVDKLVQNEQCQHYLVLLCLHMFLTAAPNRRRQFMQCACNRKASMVSVCTSLGQARMKLKTPSS